jgi:hypothetical protein
MNRLFLTTHLYHYFPNYLNYLKNLMFHLNPMFRMSPNFHLYHYFRLTH